MLHTTPVMDHIGLSKISEETTKDETLHKLRSIIMKGQTWIPKSADKKLRRFSQILPTITVTNNGLLLMDGRIILPASLYNSAIELAHRGSQINGIQRRLRYHFFFHDLNEKVNDFVQNCYD